MSKGLDRYDGKDKRRQRMKNHIAKDLRGPKYHQRVVPDKRNKNERYDQFDEDED